MGIEENNFRAIDNWIRTTNDNLGTGINRCGDAQSTHHDRLFQLVNLSTAIFLGGWVSLFAVLHSQNFIFTTGKFIWIFTLLLSHVSASLILGLIQWSLMRAYKIRMEILLSIRKNLENAVFSLVEESQDAQKNGRHFDIKETNTFKELNGLDANSVESFESISKCSWMWGKFACLVALAAAAASVATMIIFLHQAPISNAKVDVSGEMTVEAKPKNIDPKKELNQIAPPSRPQKDPIPSPTPAITKATPTTTPKK